MKRTLLLIVFLVCVASLSVGCDNSNEEESMEIKNTGGGVVIGYSAEDKEKIFGSLSNEEIGVIIEKISDEVAKDENYADNFDSIIVDIFKESGINDTDRLEEAKTRLAIQNNGSLKIEYDIDTEKEIFGEMSKEKKGKLLSDLASEVYEDEDYESNLDSIIERVFKDNGIEDPLILNAAKTGIKVYYCNSQ